MGAPTRPCRGCDRRLVVGPALGWLAALWVIGLCVWVAAAQLGGPLSWMLGLPAMAVLAAVQLTRGRPAWALGSACVLLVFSMLAVWTVGVFMVPAPFLQIAGALFVWWAIGWGPGI